MKKISSLYIRERERERAGKQKQRRQAGSGDLAMARSKVKLKINTNPTPPPLFGRSPPSYPPPPLPTHLLPTTPIHPPNDADDGRGAYRSCCRVTFSLLPAFNFRLIIKGILSQSASIRCHSHILY